MDLSLCVQMDSEGIWLGFFWNIGILLYISAKPSSPHSCTASIMCPTSLGPCDKILAGDSGMLLIPI